MNNEFTNKESLKEKSIGGYKINLGVPEEEVDYKGETIKQCCQNGLKSGYCEEVLHSCLVMQAAIRFLGLSRYYRYLLSHLWCPSH